MGVDNSELVMNDGLNIISRQSTRSRKQVLYTEESSSQPDPLDNAFSVVLQKDQQPVPSRPATRRIPKQMVPAMDLTGDEPAKAPVKRAPKKRNAVEAQSDEQTEGHVSYDKPPKKQKVVDEEKRSKRFRKAAPLSFKVYQERALSERLFVLNRKRGSSQDCPHSTTDCPEETVDMAGSTGNVYTITITHTPKCTCPNFVKGNPQCKHIINVLVKVLRAPARLQYQLAFLTSELREIFDNAGPLPSETVAESDKDGNRKPCEGDCPICCEELSESAEPIVWCRAACGNNLHKSCFDQWAATKRGVKVPCPYCRTEWQGELPSLSSVSKDRPVGADGYVNVAQQLGLSGRRDYSTYHSFWVRKEWKAGNIDQERAEGIHEPLSYLRAYRERHGADEY